jgi:putative ABC transport system permease protein
MILRNQRPTGRRGVVLRKALVGVQFALSVAMIAGTLVAQNQLEYIRTKDLGFDRERLVVIDINSGETRRGFETIKSQMLALPDVRSVSVSSRVPGDWKNIETVDVRVPAGGTREMSYIGIDEDFLATFKIGLAGGRNISGQATVDTACVLLNRAAAAMLGWDDPVGREIEVKNPPVRLRVVGLVGDFHFASLHEPVGPLVLGHRLNPIDRIDYFTARLAAGSGPGVIADLAAIHETFDTSTPFEHNVLDDRIGDFYAADRLTGDIFAIAAGLAIAIACLGLLGLISYTTDLRTKEIGIRKVLGASSSDILTLLSKDIAVPAVVAAAVASPVAWLAIESWLGDFAYRIDVGPGTFLVAAVSAGVIAAGTVSFHALRAAQRNPVDTIRYE